MKRGGSISAMQKTLGEELIKKDGSVYDTLSRSVAQLTRT